MAWQDGLTTFPLNGRQPLIQYSKLTAGQKIDVPEGCNIGIATGTRSGFFAVDCDSEAAARAFLKAYPFDRTYTVKTPRGYHFYFLLPDDFIVHSSVKEILPDVDIRGEGSLVIGPGSIGRDDLPYTVFDDTEPCTAPDGLLQWLRTHGPGHNRNEAFAPIPVDPTSELGRERLTKAKEYLATAPPAVQGESGSVALFTVCLTLVRTYELPIKEAHQLILDHYNQRCIPPWSPQEIQHKLEDARDKSDRLPGMPPDGMFDRLISKASDPIPEAAGKLANISFTNLCQTLHSHPDWQDVFRFNVLTRRPVAINPPVPLRMQYGSFSNGDVGQIRLWLAEQGFTATVDNIKLAVETVYEKEGQEYNPIVEYLDGLHYNGVPVINNMHDTVLHSPDGEMASRLLLKHLVAACRRARSACGLHRKPRDVDHQIIYILCGEQDAGKTRFIKTLAGEFYGSLKGDLKKPDTVLKLQGKLCIEMEEMVSQRKADYDSLKAFLSQSFDHERAPYGRSAEEVSRSYVMFGSCNDLYLEDPTGNRRYGCVEVGKLDCDYLAKIRDQVWAHADLLARSDFDHHLDDEEKAFIARKAQLYEVQDPLAERLEEVLCGVGFITLYEAYKLVMQSKAEPVMSRQEVNQYATSLRRIGCKNSRSRQRRGWMTPEHIASKPANPSVSQWLKQEAMATKLQSKLEGLAK